MWEPPAPTQGVRPLPGAASGARQGRVHPHPEGRGGVGVQRERVVFSRPLRALRAACELGSSVSRCEGIFLSIQL